MCNRLQGKVFGFDNYEVESILMYFIAIKFVIQKSRNIDRTVRHGVGVGEKKATPKEYLWKYFLEDLHILKPQCKISVQQKDA